jgi:hypothetical protein
MTNRGNMGKQIANAPKSKKVKKMYMGGMADTMEPVGMKKGGSVKKMAVGGRAKTAPPQPVRPLPSPPRGGAPKMPMEPVRQLPSPPRGGMGPGIGMAPPMQNSTMPVRPLPSPPRGGMAPPAMQRRTADMPQMGGGMAGFKAQLGSGGAPQMGGMANKLLGMKKGGAVKKTTKGSSSARGDGCCMKGKTKGKMY